MVLPTANSTTKIESVCAAMATRKDVEVHGLAVMEVPRSGQPDELLDRFGISCSHIVEKVKAILS